MLSWRPVGCRRWPRWRVLRWTTSFLILALVIVLSHQLLRAKRSTLLWSDEPAHISVASVAANESDLGDWSFLISRDADNRGLSDIQCDASFPDLYQELDRARTWHQHFAWGGVIREKDIGQWDGRAQMRLLIYNGQLRILNAWGIEGPHIPDRPLATIQAIHRALVAIPNARSSIPNIEFTIDTQDDSVAGGPKHAIWTYCRPRDEHGPWVMPDFGFWSFPSHTVGAYEEFRESVSQTEEVAFADKSPKLVWRGSEGNGGEIRRALYNASYAHPWADVRWLDWGDPRSFMDMHDFCRFRFAAHTEGITWSGRLRYLQHCANVVITHQLDYVAHYYPLMRFDGPLQNTVQVHRNYSNLETVMAELLSDPELAERIATNAAQTFRDRYLTPAAEACYWRRMFKTWREVQGWEPRIWDRSWFGKRRRRGVAWEECSVTGRNWGL